MGANDDDPGLPLKLWPCSNGEYLPPPLDELRAGAMRRARSSADLHADRDRVRIQLDGPVPVPPGAAVNDPAGLSATEPLVASDALTTTRLPR